MLALLLLLPADSLTEFLTDATFVADNPTALFAGRPEAWDVAHRERGWLLRDGDRLRLWYTGYDGTLEGLRRLGLADVNDGEFRRVSDRPISPDGVWVEDVCVVRDGPTYHLFCEGRLGERGGGWIHRLSSADGREWTHEGPIAIEAADGSPLPPGPTGTPVVVRHDEHWWLFYERFDAGIWVATSADLKTWTNASDQPVFRPSESGFDSELIAFNQIVRDGDRWVALYHGSDREAKPRLWACGAAASDDLMTWTRLSEAPFTRPAENLSSPSAIRIGGQWRLYTTHGRVDRLRRLGQSDAAESGGPADRRP